MNHRIVEAYRSEFEQAPKAASGDVVTFERLDPKNPAWFFGRDPEGTCGYFPVAWFALDGTRARALRAYDATELAVAAHTRVMIVERHAQWVLVIDKTGRQGWVPEACVAEAHDAGGGH